MLLGPTGCTQVVCRNEAVPATGTARPILVATRNDALASVIASTPPERRKDLVFMQVCVQCPDA